MCEIQGPIKATVSKVVGCGVKRYAVTYLTADQVPEVYPSINDSITFSLHVWESIQPPFEGQGVMLFRVSKHRNGWRAAGAKPFQQQ